MSLRSLICAPLPLSKHHWTNNPIIHDCLRIWSQLRIHFELWKALITSPILSNVNFTPSLTDPSFKLWHRRGIKCVKDLFKEGHFMSFEQLKKDFDIPQSAFFKYLQIRSYVRKHFSLTTPHSSWIDDCLNMDPVGRGVVSVLYDIIQRVASPSLNHLMRQWEEELGITISDRGWQTAIKLVHSSSICIRNWLLQFKVLHRLHLSANKLAKLYPGLDSTCIRCNRDPASLSHMFWLCSKLAPFWEGIFNTFSYMYNMVISPNPLTALFGVVPQEISTTSFQDEAIAFSTFLARRLILLSWKKVAPPSHRHWVEEVMSYLKLERLKHTIRGSTQRYYTVWQPFLSYFEREFLKQ